MREEFRWAGNAYGTNIGNLYLEYNKEEDKIDGILRFNDSSSGMVVFDVFGVFDGSSLSLESREAIEVGGSSIPKLKIVGNIDGNGMMRGRWETAAGNAGTFILHPHSETIGDIQTSKLDEHAYSIRHEFGAVEISKDDILNLANEVHRQLPNSRPVITVSIISESFMYTEAFETTVFPHSKARVIRIFGQQPDLFGTSRTITLEFGPVINLVQTQGADEAWVLGTLERLKIRIRPFESSYATNFRKIGAGINQYGIGMQQVLLLVALIYAPSLSDFSTRLIFIAGVLLIIGLIIYLHRQFLPHAIIYLTERPVGFLSRVLPSVLSWTIAATASLAAALLGAYISQWISALSNVQN